MPLLESLSVSKITVFLVVTMLSASAMPQSFNQTKRLAYQGSAISHSNRYFTYYDGQREYKNYIKSAELHQKSSHKGDTRAHTVLAINITIAKICLKVLSKQVNCIEK